jgi:hypothetical protein
MTSKERVAIALQGGKPDRIPIVPFYDDGYVQKNTGRDVRSWGLCSAREGIQMIEEGFLLHKDIDGMVVHDGWNDDASKNLKVEKLDSHWRVTDTTARNVRWHRPPPPWPRIERTGSQWGLLPDRSVCAADGTPIPRQSGGLAWESKIQTTGDIDSVVGLCPTEAEMDATGRFWPLRHLTRKYPDFHFSFQTNTPHGLALSTCGYVEGLTTMLTDPALFRRVLARYTEIECTAITAGKKAGADSTWFTCFYSGADTISPKTYADLIFPYELEICREAKRQGLFVLNWYLGDLMPVLDKVMQLPLDALVLEQGRKGYVTDPVEIRRRVGPHFCLFGFAYENDFCTFNREGLRNELRRQIKGVGMNGAFIVGTPIMPADAVPAAVDYYFQQARELG